MDAVLDEVGRRDPRFRAEVTSPIRVLPMDVPADLPVVSALRAATQQVVGADPGVHGWSATCDASVLVHDGQTPTVIFGPGSIEDAAHRPDESVSVDELNTCAEIYVLTILELLGMRR
jgi:acetylornithine deacetylase